jgi:hypothetical protein
MRINDSSNQHLSLYHDALKWAGVSSTQYPFDPEFLRDANLALDLISSYIMRFDGAWEWHDYNLGDQPIADDDLVSGQASYSLTLTHYKILRVRVQDSNGDYVTLKPIQRRTLTDSQLAATGTPNSYDKLGNAVIVNPTPDYGSTGGLELQFQTGAEYFLTSDTSKEPGFSTQFHRLVSLLASLDRAERDGNVKKAKLIRDKVGYCPEPARAGSGMLGELCVFYSQRDYDEEPKLELKKSNRGIALL